MSLTMSVAELASCSVTEARVRSTAAKGSDTRVGLVVA
jgi:hypothetical protein